MTTISEPVFQIKRSRKHFQKCCCNVIRIDAVVETKNYIYLFEFKKNRTAEVALQQIIDNKYADRFALSKKGIYLIGMSFSLQKRGINDYAIVKYPLKDPSV